MPISTANISLRALLAALYGLTFGLVAVHATDQPGNGQATASGAQAVQVDADKRAVRDLILNMKDALDKGDFQRYANYFTEDGVFTSGIGKPVTGRIAIAAMLNKQRAMLQTMQRVTDNIQITVTADKATAVYDLMIMDEKADLSVAASTVMTNTFRKENGIWRIAQHETKVDTQSLIDFAASQRAEQMMPSFSCRGVKAKNIQDRCN
jgi:uncharacterized protein (TIGR02246 family)